MANLIILYIYALSLVIGGCIGFFTAGSFQSLMWGGILGATLFFLTPMMKTSMGSIARGLIAIIIGGLLYFWFRRYTEHASPMAFMNGILSLIALGSLIAAPVGPKKPNTRVR